MKKNSSYVVPPGTIPIRISRESTHLIEPLQKNGEGIDYALALEQHFTPEIPPKENGYRDLFRAFGKSLLLPAISIPPEALINETQWDHLCKRLNLSKNLVPTHSYHPLQVKFNEIGKNFGKGRKKIVEEHEEMLFEELQYRPWTKEEFPVAAEWLEENATLFQVFEKAITKPRMYASYFLSEDEKRPFETLLNPLMSLGFSREIAKCLRFRSNFQMDGGNEKAVWEDILRIFRLSRHIRRNPFMVSQLIGIAVEGIAKEQFSRFREFLSLSRRRLRAYRRKLEELPEPLSYEQIVLSERLFGLDEMVRTSRYGLYEEDEFGETVLFVELFPVYKKLDTIFRKLPLDWNLILKLYNKTMDRLLTKEFQSSEHWSPFPDVEGTRLKSVSAYRNLKIRERSEELGKRLILDSCGMFEAFWKAFQKNRAEFTNLLAEL